VKIEIEWGKRKSESGQITRKKIERDLLFCGAGAIFLFCFEWFCFGGLIVGLTKRHANDSFPLYYVNNV
jgi:hypothetical protein